MKSLKTIQTLAKIGKILSRIIFIFCIVGFCGCVIGLIGIALGANTLKFGHFILSDALQTKAQLSVGSVCAAMSVGMILCIGEAVLAKIAENYFKHELSRGTPFSFEGAKEMLSLGIFTICIPIASQIAAAIVHTVVSKAMNGAAPLNLDNSGSVSLGIMFIVMSVLCKYGAELTSEKSAKSEE